MDLALSWTVLYLEAENAKRYYIIVFTVGVKEEKPDL